MFHSGPNDLQYRFHRREQARIAYETSGQGEPVVLIHGFTLDMSMWDDQMPALRQRFSVLRYDVRGFGRSSVPHDPYTHHEDLNALLDALDIPSAHIVGLSMGGGIALRFACVYPERVRSLIVVDGTLPGHAVSNETSTKSHAVYALARNRGLDSAREAWLQSPLFQATNERPEVARRLRDMVTHYSGWHWLNDDPVAEIDPPVAARLQQITAPTLVIVGERDIAEYQAFARRMAEEIPGAQLDVIPNVGHMANTGSARGFQSGSS